MSALFRKTIGKKDKLPQSCTHPLIGMAGVFFYALALVLLRKYFNLSTVEVFITLVISYALPVVVLDILFLKNFSKPSTGLSFQKTLSLNPRRVLIKLFGMLTTLFLIVLAYSFFPEYRGSLYFRYWVFLVRLAPYFAVLVVPYFLIVDRYMEKPEDGYFEAGRFFAGDWENLDFGVLRQFFLGWMVKAFFLPLMYVYFTGDLISFQQMSCRAATTGFGPFYRLCVHNIYMLDTMIAVAGYLLTLRIFDSHICSTDRTISGWTAALICYQPFWGFLSSHYIIYGQFSWDQWLANSPWYPLWGTAILLCLTLYVFATVAFGVRFSNLTHRGIITNGPYRWTKHPAYVGKNLSYWLIAVPWLPKLGFFIALRSCVLLFLVNLIYYWRARTEERHLSRDPVYVEYALAMNEHSVFAPLKKLCPFLKYEAPRQVLKNMV